MVQNAKVEFERVVQALAASTSGLNERIKMEAARILLLSEEDVPAQYRDELRRIQGAISDQKLEGQPEASLISRIVTGERHLHKIQKTLSRPPSIVGEDACCSNKHS
jgi:hypothetical protein